MDLRVSLEQGLSQQLDALRMSGRPELAVWSESIAIERASLLLYYWRSQLTRAQKFSAPCLVIVPEMLKSHWFFFIQRWLPQALVLFDGDLPQSLDWQDFDLILCSNSAFLSLAPGFRSETFSWVVWEPGLTDLAVTTLKLVLGLNWSEMGLLMVSTEQFKALREPLKALASKPAFDEINSFALADGSADKAQVLERIYLLSPDDTEQAYQAQLEQKIVQELKSHLQDLGLSRSRPFLNECLTRLRLMAVHPSLGQLTVGRDVENSTKQTFLRDWLFHQKRAQQRVLIVSHFIQVLNRLAAQLKKRAWPSFSEQGCQLLTIEALQSLSPERLADYQQIIYLDPWPNLKYQPQEHFALSADWRGSISYLLLAESTEEKMLRFYLSQYKWGNVGEAVFRGPCRQLKDYELLQWLPGLN